MPHRLMHAALAALTLAGVVVLAPAGAANAAAECGSVPIFETDGYHSTETGSNWTAFDAHVPAGYTAQKVLYADGVFPLVDPHPLDVAVADGVQKLDAAVRAYHATCPTGRMILAGYSEGAAVAGNEIETLARGTAVPHGLISGVLYGDPRRPFGEGGRAGTAGGIETNLPTIFPGVTMQGPHEFGDVAVREICHENDGICNSVNLLTNTPAFVNGLVGYGSGAHAYDLDPVRDQGSGLIFTSQAPVTPYGPTLLPGVPTPWQLQHATGVTAAVPAPSSALGSRDPWLRLVGALAR